MNIVILFFILLLTVGFSCDRMITYRASMLHGAILYFIGGNALLGSLLNDKKIQ